MSIKLMSIAWDKSNAQSSELLLLLALSDYADDRGYCWPSHARLAQRMRVQRHTVLRAVRRLESYGEIYVHHNRGGGNKYVVLLGLSDADALMSLTKRCRLSVRAATAILDQARINREAWTAQRAQEAAEREAKEAAEREKRQAKKLQNATTSGPSQVEGESSKMLLGMSQNATCNVAPAIHDPSRSTKNPSKDSCGGQPPQGQTSDPPAQKRVDKTPTDKTPKVRPRDPLYDVLAERSFGLDLSQAIPSNLGSRIGKLKAQVAKDFPDLRPEELQAAYDHFARANPRASTPRGAGTITAMITDYRHSGQKSEGVVYTPADLDRLREEQARQTEEEADRLMAEMQERLRYGLAATRNRSHENDQEA